MTKGEKTAKYMRKMATGCQWKVTEEICYKKSDGSEVVLIPGVWYTGVPYTRGKKKRLYTLGRFRRKLKWGYRFTNSQLLGSDCSSAASFSWKKIKRDFPVLNTRWMFEDLCGMQLHLTHLQYYEINEKPVTSKEIILSNEKEGLLAAYTNLKAGDGLLQYDGVEKKGHVMIVSGQESNEAVRIIDQKGFGKNDSGRDDTSWRVDFPYTYETLMEEGYLPVFVKEK